MANFRYTITENGTTQLCTCAKPRTLQTWFAMLNAYGTFSGGMLTYQVSTNGGTTKVNLKDYSGTVYTATADDAVTMDLGVASINGREPILYAVLTGAGTPSITIDVMDNT